MTSFRRLAAALGLSAALIASSAGVASAQTWTHTDSARDVVRILVDGSTRPAPDRRAGDIRRVTIRHTTKQVIIRFSTTTPLPRDRWYFSASIQTRRYTYGVHVGGKGAVPEKPALTSSGPGGDLLRCAGVRFVVDQRASRSQMVVPRSCLDRPRTVRARFIFSTSAGKRTFHDTGLAGPRRVGEQPYSPWLRAS